MRYDVYLGSLTIYGVTDVTEQSGRGLDVYDGLGQGNYPVPKSKDLRTWDVSCEFTENNDRGLSDWTSARRMFKQFESILNSKNSRRLVITSDYGKISVPVLLESYTKTEKYSGVYEVTIKFTEYKPVGKKTANVPHVERPGKIPEPPKARVFNSHTEVAAAAISNKMYPSQNPKDYIGWSQFDHNAFPKEGPQEFNEIQYQWLENGKVKSTTNPNMVPLNTEIRVEEVPKWIGEAAVTLHQTGEAVSEVWGGVKDTISLTRAAMSKAVEDFKAQQKK